jgi:TonB family protein
MRTMLVVAMMLCACGAKAKVKAKEPDLASDRQRQQQTPGRVVDTTAVTQDRGSPSPETAAPVPVEVKSLKRIAIPRGDYSYSNASKDYPAEARRLGIEGKIRVKLLVDGEGNVRSARLLTRLGHGLDELALARARQIVFEPARDLDDRPVASIVIWTFQMTLGGER